MLNVSSCTSRAITNDENKRTDYKTLSLIYYSVVGTYDVTLKLRPRIRSDGVIEQDCKGGPESVRLQSYALGEGIYSLSVWNFNGSFRWAQHTFDVGPPDTETVYYWGRISVTLPPQGDGLPAVFVTAMPEDLAEISKETNLPKDAIKLSFVEE